MRTDTQAQQDKWKNMVRVSVEGDYRFIESNGLPDHEAGAFPNKNNPNTIGEQRYRYRVAVQPQLAAESTALHMHPFGVAVNGIPFDPGAAEYWRRDPQSGWQYEALSGKINLGLDSSNAHVQPNGAYHYHGIPYGLLKKLSTNPPSMTLLGYAADGFPIYGPLAYADAKNSQSELVKLRSSFRVRAGTRPSGPGGAYDGSFVQDYEYVAGLGDLDYHNGRLGVTPEYPNGTYYYVLTDTYPFIPRSFAGTIDPSFLRHGPPGGGPPGKRGPPPGRFPPFGPPPR